MNIKKVDHYGKTLEGLKQLKKDYPSSTLGKHLEIAFGDYSNMFSVTDRELNFALDKYISELDLNTVPDSELAEIIKDSEAMFTNDSEDQDDDYSEEDDY